MSASFHLSRDNVENSGGVIDRLVIRIHHAMGATVVDEHTSQARNDAR